MGSTVERFSNRVENYAKYRPGYPPDMLEFFKDHLGLTPDSVIADVGSGTGLSAKPFLENGNVVYAVEPNPGMLRRADKQRSRATFEIEFLDLPGERISLPDGSIDTVVSTFTMCTIPGVVEAIQGMRRVLKTSGKFIFFEHGLSPDDAVERWQRRNEPLWQWVFEGCHVTRNIPALIEQGGFKIEQIDVGYVAPFPKCGSYCFWGVAR